MLNNIKKHPRGLYLLAFTAMWEYFSYYGMRALFVLYMTKVFVFSDEKAYGVYGAFGALVYVTSLAGAWFTEKLLGYRLAICLGGLLIAIGNIAIATENHHVFYFALAVIICGNGLCKPNIVNLVGQLYPIGDARRDSAFTLFYVGANLGAFIAPLVCGFISMKYGWNWSFYCAGFGMLLGLAVFLWGRKHISQNNIQHVSLPTGAGKLNSILKKLSSIPIIIILALCITLAIERHFSGVILNIIGISLLIWLIKEALKSPAPIRNNIFSMLILMVFGTIFWAFDMQADSSIILFTDRIVDRGLGSWTIPTPMFQSINPLVIFIIGPILSWVWLKLTQRNINITANYKFSLALFQLALGFLVLAFSATLFNTTGHASFFWVVLAYLLITTGELCCEPIGLAAASNLPPQHLIGLMIAAWYLYSGSYANYLAAFIAKFTSVDEKISSGGLHSVSLVYGHVFSIIAWSAVGVGILLIIITKLTKKYFATPPTSTDTPSV